MVGGFWCHRGNNSEGEIGKRTQTRHESGRKLSSGEQYSSHRSQKKSEFQKLLKRLELSNGTG